MPLGALAFASFVLSALFFLFLWCGWATDINRIAAGLFFLALAGAFKAAVSVVVARNP